MLMRHLVNPLIVIILLSLYLMPTPYDKVDAVISNTLAHEGGFANNILDSGGATNYGITLNTYRLYVNRGASVDTLKNISINEAKQFYKEFFFYKYNIQDLPENIWDIVFDMYVNHGPGNGAIILQSALIKLGYSIEADGKMGEDTVKAAQEAYESNPKALRNAVIVQRLSFYSSILRRKPSQRAFAANWMSRCASFADKQVVLGSA